MASSAEKSTIVRSGDAPRTARLRRVFGVLERVAPRLGARLAWSLWCTPTRPSAAIVAKSRAAGTGEVRRVRISLPDWTGHRPTTRDGKPKPPILTEIAVELLGPADGPVVYLLHGWGGWRNQFSPIGRALADAGHRVVLIDTPNHGDSGPGALGSKYSLLPDFSLTLAAIGREFGPARAVVAHSLGGGCAALAVLDGLEADRVVFISPAIDPVAFTRHMAKMLGYGERIRRRMVKAGQRRTGHAFEEFIIPPLTIGRTDLPPALIVHDRDDQVVPVVSGRTLAECWPSADLVETSRLGHNAILRNEAVVKAVTEFIAGAGVAAEAERVTEAEHAA